MTQPTTLAHLQVDSPLGRLLLIATDHGLVRLAFSTEGFARVLDTVTESLQPDVVQPLPNTATTAGHLIEQAASELDDYFAGALTAFTVPVDFALSRGFHREVREHLASIPYASTVSYSTIAEHLGRPQAVRGGHWLLGQSRAHRGALPSSAARRRQPRRLSRWGRSQGHPARS